MNLKNCIVDKISTMKDGGVKIVLYTAALGPQQLAELMINVNKEIVSVDVAEDNAETKSKSTRMRNVLYRVWESKKKDQFETFELYYNHIMEKLIDQYKNLID